ncbi:hypothetical protein LINPERHAP1_LOCUS43296 [Linum perenne]
MFCVYLQKVKYGRKSSSGRFRRESKKGAPAGLRTHWASHVEEFDKWRLKIDMGNSQVGHDALGAGRIFSQGKDDLLLQKRLCSCFGRPQRKEEDVKAPATTATVKQEVKAPTVKQEEKVKVLAGGCRLKSLKMAWG